MAMRCESWPDRVDPVKLLERKAETLVPDCPRQRVSHQSRHCDGGVSPDDDDPVRVVFAPGNRERAQGTRAAD